MNVPQVHLEHCILFYVLQIEINTLFGDKIEQRSNHQRRGVFWLTDSQRSIEFLNHAEPRHM
jgi:biotin carboxylase